MTRRSPLAALTLCLVLAGASHAQTPQMLRDIWPGACGSMPMLPVLMNGRIYFSAVDVPTLGLATMLTITKASSLGQLPMPGTE